MTYLRTATYKIKTGSFQELAELARKDMLRTLQDQPGFVKYGLADLGDQTCVSLSLWETRKAAEWAASVSANWVRENIADRVELGSNEIGELAFFEGVPARV
jgi:heme-degrading monooxygenase HmoA